MVSTSNIPGVTPEGRKYFLRTALGHERAADIWLGLTLVQEGRVDMRTILAGEPLGSRGYERRLIPSSRWEVSDDPSLGARMVEPEVFRNTGSDRWPRINAVFLATSPDDGGILLAWDWTRTARELFLGDEIVAEARLGG